MRFANTKAKRRPIAILTASLLMRRPQAEIGKAKIFSLPWSAFTASSLALSISDVALSNKVWQSRTTIEASQALWEVWRGPTGVVVVVSEHQRERTNSTSLSTICIPRDRMADWRSDVVTADAKKADKASYTARRISRPPLFTGMLACSQCMSDIWMLTMAYKPSLSIVSCSWRRWWPKQGEQRRTCISLGLLNDDLIIRASWAGKRRRRDMKDRRLEILSSK